VSTSQTTGKRPNCVIALSIAVATSDGPTAPSSSSVVDVVVAGVGLRIGANGAWHSVGIGAHSSASTSRESGTLAYVCSPIHT
jgi:hypothetical protein